MKTENVVHSLRYVLYEYDLCSPEVMQDAVESQAVRPAGGEVQHVDLWVRAAALTNPTQ